MDPYVMPSTRPPMSPGLETKRVLLTLGALCLGGALCAGTALIWSALGAGGQVALMVVVTATLLLAAIGLRRLPATAEALASVGMTGLVVDAIAARTLGLPGATALSLHVYVAIAAAVIGMVSAAVSMAAPATRSPLVVAGTAPLVVVFAAVNPIDVARGALLGPVTVAVAVVVERVLQRCGKRALIARISNASGAGLLTLGSAPAAAYAAFGHEASAWWGGLLVAMLFAVPELAGLRTDLLDKPSAAVSGLLSVLLVAEAAAGISTDLRLAAVLALPVLVVANVHWSLRGVWPRLRLAVDIFAGLLALVAFVSMGGTEVSLFAASTSMAAVALVTSVTWPRDRADAESVRLGASIAASAFGSIAAALALDLRSVHVVESYVVTPALSWSALGLLAMRRDRGMPSTVLLPGLLIGTVPTLGIALHGDGMREVALLLVAAALVIAGAQLRWAMPMAVGGIEISLLVLRIVGPEVVHLPRWIALAGVGVALLVLGATWESRLADIQRIRAGVRPHIAALR